METPLDADSPFEKPVACKPMGSKESTRRSASMILLAICCESIVCSLLFPLVSDGSDAPPAASGTFVMWTVGVIGFQLVVVPTILILFHGNYRNRILLGGILGFAFFGAHWIGIRLQEDEWHSTNYDQLLNWFPIGCAIAGVPMLFLSWCFRLRLRLQSDPSKGKPITIGKLMGLTALIATVVAYANRLIDFDGELSFTSEYVFVLIGALVAGLLFLIAIFAIRRDRNLLVYSVVGYGIVSLVALLGVLIAQEFLGRLWEAVFYLSISAISFIIHSMLFTYALKIAGYRLVKVESELNR